MRLKAEIWVMSFIRRVNGEGATAVVVKRGDDEAGAIYIKIATLDRMAALYGPAPAGFEGGDSDRRWVCLKAAVTAETDIDTALERERGFDADIWIVEVEDRQGRHFLDDWLMQG